MQINLNLEKTKFSSRFGLETEQYSCHLWYIKKYRKFLITTLNTIVGLFINSKLEFNLEFSNVKYIEKDNVVFLTCKKFCSLDDYRTPAYFALGLLERYPM